jgi:type IV pilus assembly protein PilQ
MVFKKYFLIFFIFFMTNAYADKIISIDLQEIKLQDAIHILAKYLDMNVVITADVNGKVSLRLKNESAENALNFLLRAHQLKKFKNGNTWFVESSNEWMTRQTEQNKQRIDNEENAALQTRFWQIRYAKADNLAHLLQDNGNAILSARGHARVDLRTNILCVQDLPERLVEIDRLIRKLDIPVKQVLIEARLASIDTDYERNLGVQFLADKDEKNPKEIGFTDKDSTARYSLAVAKLADGTLLDVQLAALEKEGHGELISSPSLFTANQETASIESGEEIPYQEVSKSGATSVSFKKAVLSLKVTPQIMPDNKVLLQVQVNEDKPSNRMVLGVPAITTRQMSTEILARHGQTIVLGGIYESNKEEDLLEVPFLSKLPVIGILFQQKNKIENKRELLIFVTPKIIG